MMHSIYSLSHQYHNTYKLQPIGQPGDSLPQMDIAGMLCFEYMQMDDKNIGSVSSS